MRHSFIKEFNAEREIRTTVTSGVKLFRSIYVLQNTTFSEVGEIQNFLLDKHFDKYIASPKLRER